MDFSVHYLTVKSNDRNPVGFLSPFFLISIFFWTFSVYIIDYPIFIINSDRIFAFSVSFFYLFTWLNILAAKLKFISF